MMFGLPFVWGCIIFTEAMALIGAITGWRMHIWRIRFVWYDAWVGAYFDKATSTLYICPLPCIVIVWSLGGKA